MKKIIAGALAGIFLMAGAAMAAGPMPPSGPVGQWQGSQNQNYEGYNFQGNTYSNTTSFTKSIDTSATNYKQANCNYGQNTFSTNHTDSFTIANTVTAGKLQNQGLSMGQIGDQNSETTPMMYGVAGAAGIQGQTITAANEQFNGTFSLKGSENVNSNFAFHKDDTNFSGNSTAGRYNNDGWGVSGVIAGAAVGGYNPLWGVGGIIAGFAGDNSGSFKMVSNSYDVDKLNVAGFSNLHKDFALNGNLDYQYQGGTGTATQGSVTCAGITCLQDGPR